MMFLLFPNISFFPYTLVYMQVAVACQGAEGAAEIDIPKKNTRPAMGEKKKEPLRTRLDTPLPAG